MTNEERIVFAIEAEIDTDLLERLAPTKPSSEALKPFPIAFYPSGNSGIELEQLEYFKRKLNNIVHILKGKPHV